MGEETRPGVQTGNCLGATFWTPAPREPQLLWIVREALETLGPDWRLAEAAEAAVAVG